MYVHVPVQLREGATPHTHTEGGARPVSGSGAHVTAVGSRGSPRATARRAAEVGDDDDSTRGSRRVVGCVFGCRRRDGGLGGQAAGARRLENRRHIHTALTWPLVRVLPARAQHVGCCHGAWRGMLYFLRRHGHIRAHMHAKVRAARGRPSSPPRPGKDPGRAGFVFPLPTFEFRFPIVSCVALGRGPVAILTGVWACWDAAVIVKAAACV